MGANMSIRIWVRLSPHTFVSWLRGKNVWIAAEGTFDDLVYLVILEPLGVPRDNAAFLCSSFSSPEAAEMPGVAIPSVSEHRAFARPWGLYIFVDYPSGGMLTTAKDYAKMMGAFMNDGIFNGAQMLKKETCAFMKELKFESKDDKQAVIFFHDHRYGRHLMGHSGGEEGVTTEAYFNPETGVGFAIFANEGGIDDEAESPVQEAFYVIAEELLDAFEPPEYVKKLRAKHEEEDEEESVNESEDNSESSSDDRSIKRERGKEGGKGAGGRAAVCQAPGCGKDTWNSRPGFCSKRCRTVGRGPVCQSAGCSKPTWNGEPGFCTKSCRAAGPAPADGGAVVVCQMLGCSKPTWNGETGFCSKRHARQEQARQPEVQAAVRANWKKTTRSRHRPRNDS